MVFNPMQQNHLYSVFFAPRGSRRMAQLGLQLAQLHLSPFDRLIGVVKGFVSLGGNMLTLTVADAKLLREAQRNPEAHRDLRVRMGGWSAYFTMLSEEQQEHHIRKEEAL